MTRVEERRGFEILLEEPPSAKSLWAALVKTGDSILIDKASDSVHVCLSCSREGALADARAFVDKVASAVAGEDGIMASCRSRPEADSSAPLAMASGPDFIAKVAAA
jgi:hypothetical protein